MDLFERERHETLSENAWDESQILKTIDDIFTDTIKAQEPNGHWKPYKDEDNQKGPNHCMYFGSTGILIGLLKVSQFRNRELPFSAIEFAEQIWEDYQKTPDTGETVPSLFLGSTGVLSTVLELKESPELEEILLKEIQSNVENPVNEALWGSPGTMLPALHLYRKTGDEKWKALFNENVDYLWREWKINEQNCPVWTQDLYGTICQLIGAGHGFAGNCFPLLHGRDLLPEDKQIEVLDRVHKTTIQTAFTNDNSTNWRKGFEKRGERFLVQWCHGAPGMITSLNDFPAGHSVDFDNILLKAGELTWKAGPLQKGAALCHGTDGNGMAFLKLFSRTQDELWLDRARKFAMHAIHQRSHRHSLWTGDLGLAWFLISLLKKSSTMPGLDNGYLH